MYRFSMPIASLVALLASAGFSGESEDGGRGRPEAVPQGPASAGTVAHFRFEGPTGSTPAEASPIVDLTGRHKGSVFGRPVYRLVENRAGLEFTGLHDRIAIPYSSEFALCDGLTLEAVIRYDGPIPGTLDQQHILFWGDDQPGKEPWFLAVNNDGYLVFHICGDDGRRTVQLLSPTQLPTGKLMHVAGTLDVRTRQMRLYADGKCVGSAVTDLRPMQKDSVEGFGVGIGNVQSSTYAEGFNGLICEARICNRALSPREMLNAGRELRSRQPAKDPQETGLFNRGSIRVQK